MATLLMARLDTLLVLFGQRDKLHESQTAHSNAEKGDRD
jgi:hypothetical protein